MFRLKTFIVGAGASAEFNLPTGRQLVSQIEDLCSFNVGDFGDVISGDVMMRRAFEILPKADGKRWNTSFLADVASKVRQNMGLAPSIDNFLESKRGIEGWSEVGKLAIARAILKEERASKLWFEDNNIRNLPSFAQFPQNWLTELFRILVAQKGKDEFCEALAACRFVTFNYDRVIQQFFHQAVRSYFGLDIEASDSLCRKCLNIVHVYGGLGEVSCHDARNFGQVDNVQYLVSAAGRIKTFTEGVDGIEKISIAREWISETNALIFVGFGFLPLNLQVLAPNKGSKYSKERVIGTVRNMPPDNLRIVRNLLRNEWFGGMDYTLEFEDVPASELIWRHSLYLSEADRS